MSASEHNCFPKLFEEEIEERASSTEKNYTQTFLVTSKNLTQMKILNELYSCGRAPDLLECFQNEFQTFS